MSERRLLSLRAITSGVSLGDGGRICRDGTCRAACARWFLRHVREAGAEPDKNPLAPRPGHFPGKARNVIFLMMNGGPSQVDTFDFKPALEKYAGQPLPADKKYINSGGRKVGLPDAGLSQVPPGRTERAVDL